MREAAAPHVVDRTTKKYSSTKGAAPRPYKRPDPIRARACTPKRRKRSCAVPPHPRVFGDGFPLACNSFRRRSVKIIVHPAYRGETKSQHTSVTTTSMRDDRDAVAETAGLR